MEKTALKTYLSGKYQGWDSFCETIVLPIFGKDDYEDKRKKEVLDMMPEHRLLADATGIKSVKFCAQTYVSGEPLQFFDITVSDKVMMDRNRVIVQKIIRSVMDQYSSAFMIFHYEDESKWEWRFSFCYKSENEDESTDRKRYTFLLGPGQSCRTAAENFMALYDKQQKDEVIELEDLINAFNVEALSNEFFNGYKEIYEDIIEYVTGKRMVKVANKWEEKVIHEPNEEIMCGFIRFLDPEKAVRDYVKKLMGRLVFLQFLQKKGWLGVKVNERWGEGSPTFIKDLFDQTEDKDNFIDNMLEALFNDLNTERTNDLVSSVIGDGIRVPYLNGGLFERDAADETRFPLPAEFMERMLFFFSCYNFTIDENDPNDAEVGVDPEMLGRIFENLLEDNKDKGAFYTPKEIVTYMCRESLIAYLQTDIEDEETKEAIRQFVSTHEKNDKLPTDTDQRLKDVKICDPAIGSGAFPMGLLKELFLCRTALESIEQSKAADIKKHIIQQNIYGVDIEKGAVDIARLRFWLSLIVDEETPQALPNLDYKIVEGNSLITTFDGQYIDLSTNIGINKLRRYSLVNIRPEKKALREEQKRFFMLNGDEKYRSEIAIKNHILNIIWYQLDYEKHSWEESTIGQAGLFGTTITKGRKKNAEQVVEFTQERQAVLDKCERFISELNDESKSLQERAGINIPFFEWGIVFSEVFDDDKEKGFDIVIGNPPYVKEYTKRTAFDGFRETSPYYMGKMDLWYGFACHGIDMLKINGLLCFIAQNNWTTSAGAKLMRKKVVGDGQIIQMLDFFTYMVFDDADIQTMIMLFRHNNFIDNYKFDYRTLTEGAKKEDMLSLMEKKSGHTKYLSPKIQRERYKDKLLTFSENEDILEKISAQKVYLQEDEATNGIHTHHDCVSKKIHEMFPDLPVGKGIFVLSEEELSSLNLASNELTLIKPLYNSEEIHKYWINKQNHQWIIYTSSAYKNENSMDEYPRLKQHLDNVKKAITSDNKPYGLHRAREERFFKGEKIISLRKCVGSPCFAYCDFDCYVPAMYYVIQTNRWNMRYLTGVLNSKLVAFWLRKRGKMQGENYQVDKEPLMNIPLPAATIDEQNIIAECVSSIIESKKSDSFTEISALESKIDNLVYQLYGLTEEDINIVEGN